MGPGKPRHVYLGRDQEIILDAIAEVMGSPRVGVRPSRSKLIAKAVQNFIDDCRADPTLAAAIESVEKGLERGKFRAQGSKAVARGLLVVPRKA